MQTTTHEPREEISESEPSIQRVLDRVTFDHATWARIVIAVVAVAAVSLVMLTFREELGVLNVMLIFLILSILPGVTIGAAVLMSQLRAQTDAAIRENHRTTLLYDLNRSLAGEVTLDQLLRTIT